MIGKFKPTGWLIPIATGFLLIIHFGFSCRNPGSQSLITTENSPLASRPTEVKAEDGRYISWKEHLIDGLDVSGVPLSGSDGLVMADLDLDGFEDIVSVHEADTRKDGEVSGYVRIAFGSPDPDQWHLVSLAKGKEAGAAEDAAIADMNGDGYPDIVAACELEHLIYFQNPGSDIRSARWERVIPNGTANRGSFIRTFLADFNGDGNMDLAAANYFDKDVSVLLNTGTGTFAAKNDYALGHSFPASIISADLDGDGDRDIATANFIADKVGVLFNDGDGIFAGNMSYIVADAPYSVFAADLDKDGDPDVLRGTMGNGLPVQWIDDDDDMQEGDLSGDRDSDCLMIDKNKDGHYGHWEDFIVDYADEDKDGMADLEIIAENTKLQDRRFGPGLYMIMIDNDKDGVLSYIDWEKLHAECWQHDGMDDFMIDYSGNSTLLIKALKRHDGVSGQKWCEMLFHANRPHTRSAAAVRNTKCLV